MKEGLKNGAVCESCGSGLCKVVEHGKYNFDYRTYTRKYMCLNCGNTWHTVDVKIPEEQFVRALEASKGIERENIRKSADCSGLERRIETRAKKTAKESIMAKYVSDWKKEAQS